MQPVGRQSSDLLIIHLKNKPCSGHLYQVGSRHPPLLKVLLSVLLLHLQGKARPQDSLRVVDGENMCDCDARV